MAYSAIDPKELMKWLRIEPESVPGHPQAKMRLRLLSSPEQVLDEFAASIFDEIVANNRAGRPTRLILPCGPRDHYPLLAQRINRERVSLRNVHIFHMDDMLDWQGRPLPLDHPFSFQGWMRRNWYDAIDPELNVPEEQRHFPSPFDPDAMDRAVEEVGGIDTAYGGVGYHGHVAFNEPPASPWYTVTPEEFRNSKTRVLHLNPDTLIALSQREAGGCLQCVPPMAVTIGMKAILSAKRIRLYSTTGAWKQTVVRIAVFGPVTPEYPVTFCQENPDCVLTVDRQTAKCPV